MLDLTIHCLSPNFKGGPGALIYAEWWIFFGDEWEEIVSMIPIIKLLQALMI